MKNLGHVYTIIYQYNIFVDPITKTSGKNVIECEIQCRCSILLDRMEWATVNSLKGYHKKIIKENNIFLLTSSI